MSEEHDLSAPEKLVPWEDFHCKYNLDEESLERSGLAWGELESIYQTHRANSSALNIVGRTVSEFLRLIPEVHSIRMRVKDPEHLVAKVIRKNCEARASHEAKQAENDEESEKSEEPETNPEPRDVAPRITFENYEREVTDLIGVRVLTLFREGMQAVHDGIIKVWEPFEKTCNYRKGDPQDLFPFLEEQGFRMKEHPDGYRSWHYLIDCFSGKHKYTAEIQARTILEEAWSEIDHKIRYPHNLQSNLLNNYLSIMNRLTGTADSMGSYVMQLKQAIEVKEKLAVEMQEMQARHQEDYQELENQIDALRTNEKVSKKQIKALKKQVETLKEAGLMKIDTSVLNNFSTGGRGVVGSPISPRTYISDLASTKDFEYLSARRDYQYQPLSLTRYKFCSQCGKQFGYESTASTCFSCLGVNTQGLDYPLG